MKFKKLLAHFALKGSQRLLVLTQILFALPVLFIGCANLSETLSEPNQQYDFRKTRWNFSKAQVMLAEQGKRLYARQGDVIIFNHSIDDVKCKIVYCFKDNKLRAAGYITDKPVQGAQKIIKRSVDELGEPNHVLSDGMLWQTPKTLIYSNAYLSRVTVGGISEYKLGGGVIAHLLKPRAPAGHIKRWDGVWAYIDLDFYEELHGERFPLNELSFYEKILFGALKRNTIYTYYSGSRGYSMPR